MDIELALYLARSTRVTEGDNEFHLWFARTTRGAGDLIRGSRFRRGERSMNWSRAAVATPLILLGYLVVTDWRDLYPWNDIQAKPLRENVFTSVVNYSPLVVIAWSARQRGPLPALVGVGLSGAYLAGHVSFWWIPYLFGDTPEHRAHYDRLFSRTLKFWPRIDDHPVPDAQHTVVGVLTTLMLVSQVASRVMRRPREERVELR